MWAETCVRANLWLQFLRGEYFPSTSSQSSSQAVFLVAPENGSAASTFSLLWGPGPRGPRSLQCRANTLWTVGFPGIQGKQRFVFLLQVKKEKETLCVCVYALGCQKQEDRNRGGERKIHFQSFGNSEVSLVTQGCSSFFFLCLFKLAFLLDEPRI